MNDLIKVENMTTSIPEVVDVNQTSHDRCIQAGESLIERINQTGMTDELDKECEVYIRKARNTVKQMSERRSPVTKLFDVIRGKFTAMENDINPSTKDSIANTVQLLRNQFAKQKFEEAERARKAEQERVVRENERRNFRVDLEESLYRSFGIYNEQQVNRLQKLYNETTLENYSAQSLAIKNFPTILPADWNKDIPSSVYEPKGFSILEIQSIRKEIANEFISKYSFAFKVMIEDERDRLLRMLPSKRTELENLAKASAEEAAMIEANMKAREAEENARIEQQRKAKEEEERKKLEMEKQASQMDSLFCQSQSSNAVYQPKIAAKKKLVPITADAFMPIISLWWSREGSKMSVEELTKVFKKQITFCEKRANAVNPELISSPYIKYEDDIKAK